MQLTFDQFKQRIEDLNREMDAAMSESNERREMIYDGPIDAHTYFECHPRMLWLMKEPYDGADGKGGGWSFSEASVDPKFRHGLVFGKGRRTWQPVNYITYCVLNGYAAYDDVEDLAANHSMLKSLDSIAWVNIQKLPSKNVTTTNMADVMAAARKYHQQLLSQINLLDPDVIICGGTILAVREFLPGIEVVELNENRYLARGKTLIIPAAHPSRPRMKRVQYVDGIVAQVKCWIERNSVLSS